LTIVRRAAALGRSARCTRAAAVDIRLVVISYSVRASRQSNNGYRVHATAPKSATRSATERPECRHRPRVRRGSLLTNSACFLYRVIWLRGRDSNRCTIG
jgi:hypothetical protein